MYAVNTQVYLTTSDIHAFSRTRPTLTAPMDRFLQVHRGSGMPLSRKRTLFCSVAISRGWSVTISSTCGGGWENETDKYEELEDDSFIRERTVTSGDSITFFAIPRRQIYEQRYIHPAEIYKLSALKPKR